MKTKTKAPRGSKQTSVSTIVLSSIELPVVSKYETIPLEEFLEYLLPHLDSDNRMILYQEFLEENLKNTTQDDESCDRYKKGHIMTSPLSKRRWKNLEMIDNESLGIKIINDLELVASKLNMLRKRGVPLHFYIEEAKLFKLWYNFNGVRNAPFYAKIKRFLPKGLELVEY